MRRIYDKRRSFQEADACGIEDGVEKAGKIMHNIYIYILIMAGVSFLIRVLPMVLLRRPITNRFLRSFLYYVPYVTLAVMTFPAILEVTDQPLIGAAALVAGIVLAYLGAGLFPVAIACCVIVFVLQMIV
jgi:branched-subunit amino acid transport protein